MGEPRIVVVGAGPAGVRAAETLVAAGVRPVVIDEGRRDGGQIYRRQPEGFTRSYATLYGTEAAKAEALHAAFAALRSRIDDRPRTLAWNIWDNELHVVSDGRNSRVRWDALIICPGAVDRIMPVPGWHLAGTYSLGAAQIALKAQACVIGQRTAFIGTGPLLYLVARQYAAAGANVAAVLDTSPFGLRIKAMPGLLARPAALAKGVALVGALKRAGVRVATGITPVHIGGTEDGGVQGLSWRSRSGTAHDVACDAVALGSHVKPETQLADIARCAFRFDADLRQWLPVVDADGRSSQRGIYLAGDGGGIAGADAAELAGRLAALAALADLARPVDGDDIARLRTALATQRRFSRALQQAFPWPAAHAAALPDATIVCRCEEVTAGAIRHAARDLGATDINRAKAFCRVGMGRCQGRYCGDAAAEVIAAALGAPIAQVGRLRGQAPVKPLPMATIDEAVP